MKLKIKVFVFLVSIFSLTTLHSALAADPIGYLESISCNSSGTISTVGWAFDPDISDSSISVALYDGSTYERSCATSVLRDDVNTSQDITGNHGFYCDGAGFSPGTHSIHVYAIDSANSDIQIDLPLSPPLASRSIVCPEPISPPTVTTNAATNITSNSATLSASLENADSGWDVTIAYQANGSPTQISCGAGLGGDGKYYCYATGLTPNTTYSFRALAFDDTDSIQGEVLSFTTDAIVPPSVTTLTATNVATFTATGNGRLDDSGGEDAHRYIALSTDGTDFSVACNDGYGGSGSTYSCLLGGLSPNTTYYYRAEAENSAGTSHGSTLSFTTTSSDVVPPTIETRTTTNITSTTATGNGEITSTGGDDPHRFMEWGTTMLEEFPYSCDAGVGGVETYSCAMTNLSPDTTYYYKAKAVNSAGTRYGVVHSFTTADATEITAPIVTTGSASSITTSEALGSGTIESTGGEEPSRYIQWGTSSGNYIDLCGRGVGGAGSYSCSMDELSPGTTYYFRAYATNSAGTGYGNERSFTTPAVSITAPTVTTSSATSIGATNATGSGNVTATGGENPERFIEWGTTSGSYTNSCTAGTGSTGSYTCNMTALSPETTYYYRAKVTNSAGTNYGSQLSFTTAAIASVVASTVTTSATTSIGATNATGNGNVTVTGGENPERFIEWGTTSGSYTNSCTAGIGTTTGAYSCDITGLSPETTYYYRAKATNSAGTSYGSQLSFITTATTGGALPTIISITSDSANATYGAGETIDIDVNFSRALTSSGNITVTLETGDIDRTCTFTLSNVSSETCNYVVQDGDVSSDLTVKSIVGTATDADDNVLSTTIPSGSNLADNKNIIINTSGAEIEDMDAIADSIGKPKLKVDGDKKTFLSFFKGGKDITLSSKIPELAGGQVKIKKGSSVIEKAEIENDGDWKVKIKLKKTTEIRILYYDKDGNKIKEKKYKIKIDAEKPVFTDLPNYISRKHLGDTLWWRAADNEKIDHYRYELNGRIRNTKTDSFVIPNSTPTGFHIITISAYDKVGNKVVKNVGVWIRR